MDRLLPLRRARGRWIVYCRAGVRATLARATLMTLGWEDVANLEGGNAWKEAGLPSDEHHDGP
jgi:rhodanese-related sulfurtransferase